MTTAPTGSCRRRARKRRLGLATAATAVPRVPGGAATLFDLAGRQRGGAPLVDARARRRWWRRRRRRSGERRPGMGGAGGAAAVGGVVPGGGVWTGGFDEPGGGRCASAEPGAGGRVRAGGG